jgi:hypothetical protein
MDVGPKIFETDCISTKYLSLVDDFGRERACLTSGTKDNDYVIFHMKDPDGRPRVTIQLNASGTHIMLFTEKNAPAISIGLKGEEGNGIQIGRPGDGAPQIILSVPEKDGHDQFGDEPSLSIISSHGHRFVIGPDN